MKKRIIIVAALICIFSICDRAKAVNSNFVEEIYTRQLKSGGVERLQSELPKEASDFMNRIGVNSADKKDLLQISPQKVWDEILNIGVKKAHAPLSAAIPVAGVILICALANGFAPSSGNRCAGEIINSAGTLCVCLSVVYPTIKCINSAAVVIKSAAGFILCFVPVMAGIMIASGKSVAAASYGNMILVAGQIISYFASNFLIPALSTLLGVSVISSVSPRIKLENFCFAAYKSLKLVMKFAVSIFTGLITLQNWIAVSADNLGTEGIKLAIDSCVPVVGGALSDAFSTVRGCINLVKSGVGAFGIIAGGAIFLPIITECFLWIISLEACSCVGELFELKKIALMLKSVKEVMSALLAAVLCALTILIVSTAIVIMFGG